MVMTSGAIRAWRVVHTWTSLVCTLFLLMLCVTGLPLIFRDELEGLLHRAPPYPAAPAAGHADLGRIAARAQAAYPRDFVRTVFPDEAAPQVGVIMTPTRDGSFRPFHRRWYDARTGELRVDERKEARGPDVLLVLLQLHTDMFAGLPGELFLAAMAAIFVASLVSGAVLYAPFMRKLAFGAVRRGGSGHLAWLDLHNLVGVTALTWMLVVGATGIMNDLSTPLFDLWQMTDVAKVMARYGHPAPVTPSADLEAAVRDAKAAVPGARLDFVSFPAAAGSSPVHYVVWLKGDRTLTSRLLTPVLVNAVTGHVDMVARMPWYLRLLELSRPLHFGDYGGLTLKVLWSLLDALTIGVLVTGLHLWIAKRRRSPSSPPDPQDAEALAFVGVAR